MSFKIIAMFFSFMVAYVVNASWCATEGGVCSCPGGTVSYGAGNGWRYRSMVGLTYVNCNNDQFGDPMYGTHKDCYCN